MDGITILPSGVSGGGGDKAFIHVQANASSTWDINHNLGKYPSVTAVDNNGTTIIGEPIYTKNDFMTMQYRFNSACSGEAFLN